MSRRGTANPDKSRYYIDRDELKNEVRKSKAQGSPTIRLTEMFGELAKRISGSFIYDSNEDRKDCVSHALTILLEKFDKYDLNSTTDCFSYYTQIALNGLRMGWNIINGKKKRTISIDKVFIED